jgi:3-hydroxybutyryl-CoA dehydrogenase
MTGQTIGVAGLGLLGRGIAACLLAHGFRVVGYDPADAARTAARAHIAADVEDLVRRGGFPTGLPGEWPARYTEAAGYDGFAPCDFVIESVVEDLGVKRHVFEQLESVIGPAVPVASNTSALPITLLQRDRKHPRRFVGHHWCAPAHLTRFLEVIRGDETDDATIDAAMTLGRACGKEPCLVRRDVRGFVVNRLGYAVYREAFHLLESGVADVETIDRAFQQVIGMWSSVAGPFRWMDITGLPAYAAVMRRLFPDLSNATEVPATMQELIDAGHTGSASGQGFYCYAPGEAERWEKLLTEHVWRFREMQDAYFASPPRQARDTR